MSPTYEPRWRGQYAEDQAEINRAIKDAAGWRCERCRHPFDPDTGKPLACDAQCDLQRGRTIGADNVGLIPAIAGSRGSPPHYAGIPGMNYGVHHLDGHKANNRWWNTAPLCNSCHLTMESRVQLDRPFLFAHSAWFIPRVCGFYAFYYGGGLEISRDEAIANPDRWLAMGQPWLYLTDQQVAMNTTPLTRQAVRNADTGTRPERSTGASPETDAPSG